MINSSLQTHAIKGLKNWINHVISGQYTDFFWSVARHLGI